jgi:hypothetical protein
VTHPDLRSGSPRAVEIVDRWPVHRMLTSKIDIVTTLA